MTDLSTEVLRAHGGLDRWREFTAARATIRTGGDLWGIKGLVQDAQPREMTVRLDRERASVHPFGAPDQRTAFAADRVAIEKLDGTVVAERLAPRASFVGHGFDTPWDPLHRAYFNGYAMWTYLNTPFLIALPGFDCEEIEPLHEHGQTWRGLRVLFPERIASHSAQQEFYFGEDFLLRRHDYTVDVAGGFAAAQHVSGHQQFDGIIVPTIRRAYRRDAQGKAVLEQTLVSIDVTDVRFLRDQG